MEQKALLEFTVPIPKIGIGKKKNQLVLINNASVWYRYGKTRIIQDFKSTLKEWCIPQSNVNLESFMIVFHVIRHNKRKLDSDAPFFCYKWIIDTLVEMGYAKDDNKVKIVIIPSVIYKDITESSIKVKVLKWEHIE